MVDETYDVVVVGGGAAGLSGALALARARRSVLVIDAGEPRNAPAGHVHGYLAREGMPPAGLVAAGREEVTGYGGQIVGGRVATAARLGDGFEVRLHGGGCVRARRLLVTTGLVDELPDVPGVAERWGRDVLGCPYCHGWEVRGRRIGVLATGPLGPAQASLWRQWSAQVMLVTHHTPAPGAEEAERLAARGITIVDGPVAALEIAGDTLTGVRLASAEVVAVDAVVVSPRLTARAGVLRSLGLKPVDAVLNGHVIGSQIPADPTGATAVPGVWVAGNVADVRAHVIAAAAAGMNAAAAINSDLIAEETRDAVDAYRHTARAGSLPSPCGRVAVAREEPVRLVAVGSSRVAGGSQTGSQQRQTSDDAGRLAATSMQLNGASGQVHRHPATFGKCLLAVGRAFDSRSGATPSVAGQAACRVPTDDFLIELIPAGSGDSWSLPAPRKRW